MRPQDETQAWRRVRKAMAGIKGETQRGYMTWGDVLRVLTEMETLATEREKAWVAVVTGKDERPEAPGK